MRLSFESIELSPPFLVGVALSLAAFTWCKGPYSRWFAQLPGTIAHELAHYLIALITCSKPRPMSLRLKSSGDAWEMGSVVFTPGRISAGFVALAPLYVLPLIVLGLYLESLVRPPMYAGIAGYLCGTLLVSAPPSRADWEIAIRYPIGTLFAVGAILSVLSTLLTVKG